MRCPNLNLCDAANVATEQFSMVCLGSAQSSRRVQNRSGTICAVKAIVKARAGVGIDVIDVDEPSIRPGHVKLRVERGSVCGTDLHIYNWDAWASGRIKPPRIIGHELCGTIVEVGDGVADRKVGDVVASESHITCGHCRLCRLDLRHLCENTVILGVDVDGGFAPYAVIPAENARPFPLDLPREVASMQDAIGNAVHTVMDCPVEGQSVLITGMGPIGLFSLVICKVLGARKVYATEVSDYRIDLARRLGADQVLNPQKEDVYSILAGLEPGGVDVTMEMSGHPSQLDLAIESTRSGGRISLLGVYADRLRFVDMNKVIFKGLSLRGVTGRHLWRTWEQMHELLGDGKMDLRPIITHEMHFTEIEQAMRLLKRGEAGKIVLSFED